MRPRLKQPGAAGTTFLWSPDGGVVQIPSGFEVTGESAQPVGRPAAWGYYDVQPAEDLEEEQAAIGGLVLGELPWGVADEMVRHVDLRRIVDALQGVMPGLPEALAACRAARLHAELVGREDVGFLVGCVRRWRDRDSAGGARADVPWTDR